MKERVLITGASGFIGYHLVKAAQQAGLEVHAAVRPSSDLSRLKELDPVVVQADFGSRESIEKLIDSEAYSYIIHAAGATRAKSEEVYNLVNAQYTRELAEVASLAQKPVKRFVFMSSLAAIGPLPYGPGNLITEETLPAPVTSYGKSKLLAEQLLAKVKGINITTIRPTAVYGPGEKDILILFKTLSRGLDAYIGKAPQRLSFVYAQDLAEVTMAAMLTNEGGCKVYNISDGRGYEKYELAGEFAKWSKRKALRIHVPLRMFRAVVDTLGLYYKYANTTPVLTPEKLNELTAPNWMCSIEKAQKELNYQPAYTLENGLPETLAWYKEEGWL